MADQGVTQLSVPFPKDSQKNQDTQSEGSLLLKANTKKLGFF